MNRQYHVTTFRADQLQKLRNVRVHSPTIIQIVLGSKRLFWRDSTLDLSNSQLLLCEASASLSFENLPHKGRFLSRVFSFQCMPSNTMLELSKERSSLARHDIVIDSNKMLEDTLNALFSFDQDLMSAETQTFWVMGLYQQLAEQGMLHQLFANSNTTFTHTLSRYLSRNPGKKHALDDVAQRFAMSRATLIRKLKREGTQYKEVLAEVRFGHALSLMQSGERNVASLALSCGYQSEGRFSQRFRDKFGLTPSEYLRTVALN
ncbi:helix-turn-helix transcriptional regulator [Vibrio sp. TBV020]|uniref:helix-turn-helix transcriptional regulator n=1 Tax=Vibrio sp. TBV020 TaxID=3137398 RepID=UPI0038CD690C